jgi:hypothetical protein
LSETYQPHDESDKESDDRYDQAAEAAERIRQALKFEIEPSKDDLLTVLDLLIGDDK